MYVCFYRVRVELRVVSICVVVRIMYKASQPVIVVDLSHGGVDLASESTAPDEDAVRHP